MYKAPSLREIQGVLKELDKEYAQADTSNPTRLRQLDILKSLLGIKTDEPHAHQIALGGCVFIYQAIYDEYKLFSPERSHLYRLVSRALGVTCDNVLDEKTKLTALIYFINYAGAHHVFATPKEREQAEFIGQSLKTKLCKTINALLDRAPSYAALVKNFSQIRAKYEERCKQDSIVSKALAYVWIGGHSQSRHKAVQLIDILNSRLSFSPDANTSFHSQDYILRYGTLIYLMREIELEYYVRSPASSYLYQICQRITNIKTTNDLNPDQKREEVTEILAYLSRLINSPEQTAEWQQRGLNLADIRKMQDNMTDQLYELKNENLFVKNQTVDLIINSICSNVATTLAQFGVACALAYLLKVMISSGFSASTFFAYATPQYTLMIFGLLWVANKVKGLILSGISAPVMPYVSGAVKAVVRTPMHYFAAQHPTFFSQEKLASPDLNLIKALNIAPDTVFTPDEKERLNLVFDLSQEKPEPDPITTPTGPLEFLWQYGMCTK